MFTNSINLEKDKNIIIKSVGERCMTEYLKKYISKRNLLLTSGDFLILLLAPAILQKVKEIIYLKEQTINGIYLSSFVLIGHLILFMNGFYDIEKKLTNKIFIYKYTLTFFSLALVCYLTFIGYLSLLNCFLFSLFSCTLIVGWRFLFWRLIEKVDMVKRVVFVGTDELNKIVAGEILADNFPKYKVVGFLTDNPDMLGKNIVNPKVIGLIKDIDDIVKREKVDKIVVSYHQGRGKFCAKTLLNCKFNGIEVQDFHTFYEQVTGKILLNGLRPSWLIFTEGFKKPRLVKIVKRVFDIILSSIGLIVTFPILIVTVILIKLDSKGPIIYKQERVGENGCVFNIYKFRSMNVDAERYGPIWAKENDDRITRVGKIIRKLRIDEIPQMFVVLRGDMSFVGPRPERPFFVKKLRKDIPYYDQRHTVKPGITGWAAICYGYVANVEDSLEKLQYDLYYIKNISLFFDIVIVLKTFEIIFMRKGAR
ncbi:MAG: TIGR03013 family XrtA/PEP-CTERM system glycosyltransferase [bacterium]